MLSEEGTRDGNTIREVDGALTGNPEPPLPVTRFLSGLARIAGRALACQIVVALGYAQSTNTDAVELRFDVVSVKSSGTNRVIVQAGVDPVALGGRGFRYAPGRLFCNLPMISIIEEAFFVKNWQVSGPTWLTSDTFQIDATTGNDTSLAKARLMLRTTLAERFRLKFHWEEKHLPAYDLIVGRDGPRLEAVANPGTYDQTMGAGHFLATAIPIGKFADWLSSITDRPVIDMTGITGVYRIELKWTPDYSSEHSDAGILGAVQQIGLKLQPKKAALKILVIDHVERVPTPN
jgi:uncharacterized protein (TIGR03435 family)